MKKILLIILILFISVPCFAQSVTQEEKNYAKAYLHYYSGDIPNVPSDTAKTETFLFSDATGKRASLKEFLSTVMIPIQQQQIASMQAAIVQLQAKLVEMQSYVK